MENQPVQRLHYHHFKLNMEAVDNNKEVILLKEENEQLNKLLEDSAATLYAVNDQLHKERCTNEKLMTYLKESERAAHVLYGENEQLRQELLQAHKIIDELSQRSTGRDEGRHDGKHAPSNNVDYYLIEEKKLLMRHKSLANSLRSLAGELVDNIADDDIEISMIMKRFPSVDFERKAVEQDPYKSTKGWVGRRSPGKLGTTLSSEDSAEEPDPAQLVTPHKDPHISAASMEGFLFGSPSERYPLSEPRVILLEQELEEGDQRVSSEGEEKTETDYSES